MLKGRIVCQVDSVCDPPSVLVLAKEPGEQIKAWRKGRSPRGCRGG